MQHKIKVVGTRGLPATYGGIEKHCEELFSGLVSKGHEVTVYARKYYSNFDKYRGIKIKNFNIPNIKGLETFIHSFISTIDATFSEADIIHFHAQGPALFSFIPRIFTPQKKLVFTCHGVDWQRDKWNYLAKAVIKLGEKASTKFPHAQIGVSQSLIDYYRNNYNIRFQKVYNGINLPVKIPLDKMARKFNLKENEYFLFVGRLVPEKAPDLLIRAFLELKTDKKLVIVGDSAGTDDYVQKLKQMAESDERIIFTSYLYGDELAEVFSNSLAYISASNLEGLPITVLEAMSYSKPLILSNIDPHIEPVEYDNKCAEIFKAGNKEDCKNKIKNFLDKNHEEIIIMGKISQSIVEKHFLWGNIINQTEQLYSELN